MKASVDKTVEKTAAKHATSQGGLLPCLHEIQAELGYIPNDYLESIANAFSLSTAEVHGIISFYHDFRTSPSAQQSIQICCAEACQASGSRELEAGVAGVLGGAVDGWRVPLAFPAQQHPHGRHGPGLRHDRAAKDLKSFS